VNEAPTASSPTLSALPSGADKTGVSSQAISLPSGAGKIQGMGESFSAQLSTGVATFTVPITLPAARGAAQPSLSLSYSSSGGRGPTGLGWSIGLPFVARQTDRGIPKYDDPRPGKPWHPEQDRFVFNGGQELVPICQVSDAVDAATQGPDCSGKLADERMPDWSSRWQYFRPRVEGSFQRFFWSPDHRTWRVQEKSGVTMELGVALDGADDPQALETDPANPNRIYRWNLSREYDAHVEATAPAGGAAPRPLNLVAFRYLTVDGESYLSDIYDTPPAANAADAPVSQYAHHTHLAYEPRPDVTFSFRRGWQTSASRRLVRIDVASKTFDGSPSDPRHLVRRYHLDYDSDFHASLLKSVQVEGRCSETETAAPAEGKGELVSATSCDRLPAMTFDYQHVLPFDTSGKPSARDLAGFEGFDERIHAMTASPDHSIDEELTDLFDINADGLPDVLVTAPALFSGKHGVLINGSGGTLDNFGLQTIGVNGVLGANVGTITLKNPNVTPLDLDGDGVIDLLHMPTVKTYAVYSLRGGNWEGRVITTASGQSPKIDFGRDALDLKVMDVNADGLVDVVLSTGLEFQTFFALGRYPGGDGQFGHAVRTGATTSDISNDPVRTCVPWESTPVRFNDPEIKLGDMNGDGLPDIVRIRRGQIRYWPGRGNGLWGTGPLDDCPALTFGAGRDILMADSPQYSDIEGHSLRLDDVNGDGLDDLIQVRFNAVDIWLNVDGAGWTPDRHIIQGTPASPSFADRVRLVDVNGSGTRDILWGDAKAYKYIDLAGGQRPAVLTHVANGLGKTTDIEYTTSTALMLKAEREGSPWTSKAPMPVHVVTRVTNSDNLDIVGRIPGRDVTEYSYRDPSYDGRQREFRGFRTASARSVGDDNSPTSTTTSYFLLGECVDEVPDDHLDPCSPENRWMDNGREGLKGLPVGKESFDEAGVYLSTEHTTYRLRQLYNGSDGRLVRQAFGATTDTFAYDTGRFVALVPPVAAGLADAELELVRAAPGQPGLIVPDSASAIPLNLRSAQGRAHERATTEVDFFGNTTLHAALGCVDGCNSPVADEVIRTKTVPTLVRDWLWRVGESSIDGSLHGTAGRRTVFSYDAQGELTETDAELSGTLPLDRANPNRGSAPDPDGMSPIAQEPRMVLVSKQRRDDFGNVRFESGSNHHCRYIGHAEPYAELLTSETVRAGTELEIVPEGAQCGTTALTSTVDKYDRSFALMTDVVDLHGEPTKAKYDQFGRVTAVTRPSPYVDESGTAELSPLPSIKVQYVLPDDWKKIPYALVHTETQDGSDVDVDAYQNAWTYVDGLGRKIVTLDEADPAGGDGGHFIVSGLVEYDAKGATARTYLARFFDGDPQGFNLKPTSPYQRQRYDAFQRPFETLALDGSIKLRNVYHALSRDISDAEDLAPGPHSATPASIVSDGHQRTTVMSERVHVGGAIEERQTITQYLPTGEVETVRRHRVGKSDPDLVRWAKYDSLGRMVMNADPHASVNFHEDANAPIGSLRAWRYAYNDAGDLIGTSDARGCGANYQYESAGRILSEDYSPCELHQEPYSSPDLNARTGIEVLYHYDDVAIGDRPPDQQFPVANSLYLDRLAWVADRGAKTVSRYDGRGRTTGLARRVAKPGEPAPALADRYAPTWFVRKANFDAADRPTRESTGARVSGLMGRPVPALHEGHDRTKPAPDNGSVVAIDYSARGTVQTVGGSYVRAKQGGQDAPLVARVLHDADGLVTQVEYGDSASTTTALSYDDLRRLRSTQTYRSAPDSSGGSGPAQPFQLLLQDEDVTYDAVDNPLEIHDWRVPGEWPEGAAPVTRKMQYDDLYRLTQIDYQYPGGTDSWVSPFAPELNGQVDPRRPPAPPHQQFSTRMKRQTFAYDWLGNTTKTTDDTNGFFDRSLGGITNNVVEGKPYQLSAASNESFGASNPRRGKLAASYDDAGNLKSLVVERHGTCLGSVAGCFQQYQYLWDEIGRLVEAKRWDFDHTPPAQMPTDPSVRLAYRYDVKDARVFKTSFDASGQQDSTVYVFSTLELRGASPSAAGDYVPSASNEVPYLWARGARLGRVAFETDVATRHVLFELHDELGSTDIVIDQAAGDLFERGTYQAYGSVESDFRPAVGEGFREDYRFTGKEEDVEVGLTYFGQRFLSPMLGRWVSPDPLVTRDTNTDLNEYAYVKGRPLGFVDPVGLEEATPPASAPQEYIPNLGTTQTTREAQDHFFQGERGQLLKQRIEDAARQVGLNPGVLASSILAENSRVSRYTQTSGEVPGWAIGTDDYKEFMSSMARTIPASRNIHPIRYESHTNEGKHPRTIPEVPVFKAQDAVLASAVIMKHAELALRDKLAKVGGSFDRLPVEHQYALTRYAINAGIGAATKSMMSMIGFTKEGRQYVEGGTPRQFLQYTPWRVKDQMELFNKNHAERAATAHTAQAIHLSQTVFGVNPLSGGDAALFMRP
jgi:RHS repeat-associated protein